MRRQTFDTGVQPYAPDTQWTWSARENGHTYTDTLSLRWMPWGGEMSGDYAPEDISAQELWQQWARGANSCHERWPDVFRPGEVHIAWTVEAASGSGASEQAPYTWDWRQLPHRKGEDFLTYYTQPVHAETGERLNWLRLPVQDLRWNEDGGGNGGFIQEASGFKPVALQQTMDVVQVARAAGLWVPEL